MALSPDLLEILRCPENRTVLKLAEADVVTKVNEAIKAGTLKSKKGEAVSEAIDAGLVREDGAILYVVRADIPVMLIDEGIPLDQLG